jgi:hypothetical protein
MSFPRLTETFSCNNTLVASSTLTPVWNCYMEESPNGSTTAPATSLGMPSQLSTRSEITNTGPSCINHPIDKENEQWRWTLACCQHQERRIVSQDWWRNELATRHYILHESLADGSNFFTQCGRKHHNLLIMRGQLKNLLHIPSHVYNPFPICKCSKWTTTATLIKEIKLSRELSPNNRDSHSTQILITC